MDKKSEIICRCEEISKEEIEAAIADGRTTVTGIKRQTRAGMGACQGRTCSKLIMRILQEKGVRDMKDIDIDTPRSPIVPVAVKSISSEEE
ncbi:(2Fe-2S)-binding protein [Clostridia bacterium]|nr:(2Fe-2S)-binding protein [Clostridia bacterium]